MKTVYDAILTDLNEPIFRHSSTPSDIQQLSQTDASSLINHIASFKTIHNTDNPSTLCNVSYFHFEKLAKKHIGRCRQHQHVSSSATIQQSDDSLQAIYYVGGWVLRKLKSMGWESVTEWDILNEWECNEREGNLPGHWTELVDRGGLIHISQELFVILKTMDSICSVALAKVKNNCNLTALLMDAILEDEPFQASTDHIPFAILYSMCRMFTRVRCRAFVVGKKTNKSSSLRQNLMGSTS